MTDETTPVPDIPFACPLTIRRDDANKAICVEACKMLEVPKRSRRQPMFTKTGVQLAAGFPNVTITCWPDIVEAVERWHWQWAPDPIKGGLKIVAAERAQRLQLLGLAARAFGGAHWEMVREEPKPADQLGADSGVPKKREVAKPDVRRVTPREELMQLAQCPYPLSDAARMVAGRFIAQNTGKKTVGYGSVEIANGRLAWRWFETMDRKIKQNREKKLQIESVLRVSGMLPPELEAVSA